MSSCIVFIGILQFPAHIKRFVVTNCSKDRHGSIVTETVKHGILIPIFILKESHLMLILNI